MVPVGGSRPLAHRALGGREGTHDDARTRTAAESDPGRGERSGAGSGHPWRHLRAASGPDAAPRKQTTTGADAATAVSSSASPAAGTHLTLLLIQDDPGGAPIVPELLDAAGKPIRVRTARNLTEAERLLTDDVHCILLDLALPAPPTRAEDEAAGTDGGGEELAVLKHVLRLAPRHAVLALTASGDAERGAEAVRVGAQDYLFRDELDRPAAEPGDPLRGGAQTVRQGRNAGSPSRGCGPRRTPAWNAGSSPPRSSTAPRCASPPATAPAAPAHCSAATSTTRSVRPTARSTR